MNNGKWMVVYKEGFAAKIIRFFRNLFKPQDNYIVIHQENSSKDQFMDEIKVDKNIVNNSLMKADFLREINGNRKALNLLSIDRLKMLEQYYDNIIEEKESAIKKLQANQ